MKYGVAEDMRAESWTGLFDSVEEAVSKGPAELSYEGSETAIFVGEAHLFVPFITAYQVLELLEEDCASECGEAADLFSPSSTSKEAQQELEDALNVVLNAWLEKHCERCTCYHVENITRHELKKS